MANFRTRFISCPGTDSCATLLPVCFPYSLQALSVRLSLCLSLFIDFGRSNNVVAQRVHSSRTHSHTHTLRHAQRTVTLFLIHSSGRHTTSIARTNKSSGLLCSALPVCLPWSPILARPQFITPQSVSLGWSPCSDFSCHIFRARQGATAERGMTKIINNSQRKRHVAACRLQRILTVPHADQRNPLYHVHNIHSIHTVHNGHFDINPIASESLID